MKSTHQLTGIALGLSLALAAPLAFAVGDSQADLQAQAKISQSEAQSTAMAKVHNGTVASSELEKENGKLLPYVAGRSR